MISVLIYGFTIGDFSVDGSKILQNPWGIVSLVDLYTGFILFSGWIIFREKSWLKSSVWIVLVMVLGFFTASLYSLNAIHESKGNWKTFWMGKYSYE
jgi:hypothetical protein